MAENGIYKTSKVQFSEMKIEIKIPENAKMKPQSKNGYEQITYKWNDGSINMKSDGILEHQELLKTKEIPGLFKEKPQTCFKIGENEWIDGSKWYKAIEARKSGNAIPEQIRILNQGHWKDD